MLTEGTSLVIFTCEGREHLLKKTYDSFVAACDFKFVRVILSIDGVVDTAIISYLNPDLVVYNYKRRGYVNSIKNALIHVNTAYFFWLEDDWKFSVKIDIDAVAVQMKKNHDWAEMLFSQFGPLKPAFKIFPLGENLYQTTFGFSANPCICNSSYLKTAFTLLEGAEKGGIPGENGFENYLSAFFKTENLKCVIIDPVDYYPISHEGYLETTPRNWHMTNSLEQRTAEHLLTMPEPSFWRKLIMAIRLTGVFFLLIFKQFANNEVHEFCFRIVASVKSLRKRG